jgi:NO-binding membrane sensor protein with MHYT domain
MSEDVLNQLVPGPVEPATQARQDSDTWVKSYCYVRTAMVGLLLGLGVAVLFQTSRQGWHLLGSVSAYYYTPAQAIFVGALIGLAACMIALKGTNAVESNCQYLWMKDLDYAASA